MNATSLRPWGGFGVYLKYLMICETTKSLDIDKKQLLILEILVIGTLLIVYLLCSQFWFPFLPRFIPSFLPLLVPWLLDSSIHSFIAYLFICLLNTCTAIEDSIGEFLSVYIYIHIMDVFIIQVYMYIYIMISYTLMYLCIEILFAISICILYVFLHVHIYISNCTVRFWSFFQYDNNQSWCSTSIKGFEKTNFAIWLLSGLNSHVAHNRQAPWNKPSILHGALVISSMYFFSSLIFKVIQWFLKMQHVDPSRPPHPWFTVDKQSIEFELKGPILTFTNSTVTRVGGVIQLIPNKKLGGGFKYFLFSPLFWGRWSNLTDIF